MRQGDVAAARVALGAAKDVATSLSEREASHIGFFDLVFAGGRTWQSRPPTHI